MLGAYPVAANLRKARSAIEDLDLSNGSGFWSAASKHEAVIAGWHARAASIRRP